MTKKDACVICGGTSDERKTNSRGEVRHVFARNCIPCMFTGRPASKLVIGPSNKIVGVHETVQGYDLIPEFGFEDEIPV